MELDMIFFIKKKAVVIVNYRLFYFPFVSFLLTFQDKFSKTERMQKPSQR